MWQYYTQRITFWLHWNNCSDGSTIYCLILNWFDGQIIVGRFRIVVWFLFKGKHKICTCSFITGVILSVRQVHHILHYLVSSMKSAVRSFFVLKLRQRLNASDFKAKVFKVGNIFSMRLLNVTCLLKYFFVLFTRKLWLLQRKR